MAGLNKLTDKNVKDAKEPRLYSDGGGLFLRVSDAGTKSWYFRYKRAGRVKAIPLGLYADWTLAEARNRAADARRLLDGGKDPAEERARHEAAEAAQKVAEALERARTKTFDQCAASFIAEQTWKNAKHAAQWQSTLKIYVSPVFGHLPVKDIDKWLVLQVLKPIWPTKTETASRVRSRIHSVLDWAMANELRAEGLNPARWRGNLDKLGLKKRSVIAPVKHHAALAFDELPDFLKRLRSEPGTAPVAIEFLILTATRTGEVIGARWDEIDLKTCVWTIPAERMKAKREHRVPLSPRAMEILGLVSKDHKGDFVFPGRTSQSGERPLSNMAFLQLLRRMEVDVTAHGFRSTFRDWAAERTNYPREVAETALAHVLKDKVEAAYRRGDFFDKRRKMMEAWADFCAKPAAKAASVTNIGARAKA